MKRCSASLVIREMQVKTKSRHFFIATSMAMIRTKIVLVTIWRNWSLLCIAGGDGLLLLTFIYTDGKNDVLLIIVFVQIMGLLLVIAIVCLPFYIL